MYLCVCVGEREHLCLLGGEGWGVWMLLRVGVGPLSAHDWSPGGGIGSVGEWNSSRMRNRSWISLTFLLGVTCISVQLWCHVIMHLWEEPLMYLRGSRDQRSRGQSVVDRWALDRAMNKSKKTRWEAIFVSFMYCLSTSPCQKETQNNCTILAMSLSFSLSREIQIQLFSLKLNKRLSSAKWYQPWLQLNTIHVSSFSLHTCSHFVLHYLRYLLRQIRKKNLVCIRLQPLISSNLKLPQAWPKNKTVPPRNFWNERKGNAADKNGELIFSCGGYLFVTTLSTW